MTDLARERRGLFFCLSAFCLGGCWDLPPGDDVDESIPSGDPWDGETPGVAAEGEISLTLSTGTITTIGDTAQFVPESEVFQLRGLQSQENLMVSLEVDAEGVRTGSYDCSVEGAEVLLSFDFDDGSRALMSSHGGGACDLTITSFGDVGEPIVGNFSAFVFDETNNLQLVIESGSFNMKRGSSQ